MTQNGPYPDGPGQPWSGNGSEEPYREPADPWGRWGSPAPFTQPGSPAPFTQPGDASDAGEQVGGGYPPPYPPGGYVRPAGEYGRPVATTPAGWTPVVPPRPRQRPRPVVVLAVLCGVLICAGLAATAWTLTREPAATSAAGVPVPTAPAAVPTTTNNAVPAPPLNSKDARFVAKGQCVRNQGTADAPEMSISVCASGAFEVLARFDGRTTGEADAETKCAKVPDYSKWYFYDSELDSLDFVLCLKER